MNSEFTITDISQEVGDCCIGSGGAPFHILTTGTWEGILRLYVKFENCTEWRVTPEKYNKNFDLRFSYPQHTHIKIVSEEWTSGTVNITIGH